MKASVVLLPIAIIAISLGLIALIPLTDFTLLTHFTLPPCPHVILVTAPRHGSTWFLDSVEGCFSRSSAKQNYRELITASELWTSHKGPVYNITPAEAADYVSRNCSVKIFPSLEKRGRARVRELFGFVKERDIPVFLLRRRVQDAYASMVEATENGGWSKMTGGPTQRELQEPLDDRGNKFQKKLDDYFAQVRGMMWDLGMSWDEVQYEEIKDQRRIVGRHNRCVVRNCNFL